MRITKPDYYDKFKCVSSRCKDTCCKGWEIVVDEKTYNGYKNLNSDYKNEIFKNITTKDSEHVIIPKKGNECPFLNEKGLCDIYGNLGKEYLCSVCAKYPRFENVYANDKEQGLFMSCIPVAEMIANHTERINFISFEEDGELNLTEIDAELYIALKNVREKCFEIMQNKDESIKSRLLRLLQYAKAAQKCISKGKYKTLENIKIDEFTTNGCSKSGNSDLKNVISTFLNKFEILTLKWRIILEEIFEFATDESKNTDCFYPHVYENFVVYMLYGYFLDAVYDKNVIGRVRGIIACALIVAEADRFRGDGDVEKQVDLLHLFSREIEHCEENVQSLFDMAKKRACFSGKALERMISRLNF